MNLKPEEISSVIKEQIKRYASQLEVACVDGFSNAIRVHISALRKKLRVAMGFDPIHNRIGEGYLLGGPEK